MNVILSHSLIFHSAVAFYEIVESIKKENIKLSLSVTNNIWCRDYMPVQTPSGRYIKFAYKGYGGDDKYKKYPWLKVNPILWADLEPLIISSIRLDGGNCVIDYGRAFISTIVFKHNPKWNKVKLVKHLEKLLEVPVVIIPVEPGDDLGHTDGILRGVAEDKVLTNDYSVIKQKQYDRYQKSVLRVLEEEWLKYEFMPYAYHKTPWTSEKEWRKKYLLADAYNPGYGYYINFLPLGNAVLVPQFGIEEDKAAISVLNKYFKRIYPIDCAGLSMEGGLVNCCTREYRECD